MKLEGFSLNKLDCVISHRNLFFLFIDDQTQWERSLTLNYQFAEPTQGISHHCKAKGPGIHRQGRDDGHGRHGSQGAPIARVWSKVRNWTSLCPLPWSQDRKGAMHLWKIATMPSFTSVCSAPAFDMEDFDCLEINQCWSLALQLIKSNKMSLN